VIYLLLGPSGSGKTTLSQHLKEMGIPELISHSTRQPRSGESEGSPYYFVTREQFGNIPMIESTEYNGQLYGTSIAEIERVLSSGGSAFTVVDKHGCEEFKRLYGDLVKIIYVYAPAKLLADRMRARGDSEDAIADRIRFAIKSGEFDNIEIADYCIVNKDLQASIRQLKAIVEG
jgi:guanylate kinase